MKLQPITMVRPNATGIYAPSRVKPTCLIDEAEFLALADRGRAILVSFAPDGISKPQMVTAYGRWMDGWYIVAV